MAAGKGGGAARFGEQGAAAVGKKLAWRLRTRSRVGEKEKNDSVRCVISGSAGNSLRTL